MRLVWIFTQANVTKLPLAAAMSKVPAWLKRPAGASFGFGGKLVSCINEKQRDKFVNAHLEVKQVCRSYLRKLLSGVSSMTKHKHSL